MYKFGNRSMSKLIGVNPVLAYIAIKAISISKYDFGVFEGVRTIERQRLLVNLGRSTTLKSKHLTGNAIDLVPYIDGKYQWIGKKASICFKEIHRCMLEVANQIDVTLECGMDWTRFIDKPHYQLSKRDRKGYNICKYKI